MKNLSRKFARFCFKHRDKGIPNLMLYIALGNALVIIMSLMNTGVGLYELLCFDKSKILQGQVWRLFSYVFTQSEGGFLGLLFLYFFYMLGRNVEARMGTLKFNLFYFTGVLLMDAFAMIFCPTGDVVVGRYLVTAGYFQSLYANMAYYLHLSLVLAYATTYPEAQFLIFFIIPIRAWVMALFYLIMITIEVFNKCYPVNLLPHALFPLIGLLNYFLFFGVDMQNLLPQSWRRKRTNKNRAGQHRTASGKPIPFPNGKDYQSAAPAKANYTHRCTVCGRTDVSNPELEFRYCSRCNGYHCYCEDHISNHTHVE